MTISEISSRFQLKIICRRNIFWLSKTKYIVRATMHVITCICKIQPRCPRDHIVNFMSCNTVKTCACLIQGKIFGGIIEIYHACKWYLPKNTGWETGQISGADICPVSQPVFFWQIPLTSMVYFYNIDAVFLFLRILTLCY
jgi:hypothetical protein